MFILKRAHETNVKISLFFNIFENPSDFYPGHSLKFTYWSAAVK